MWEYGKQTGQGPVTNERDSTNTVYLEVEYRYNRIKREVKMQFQAVSMQE